MRERKGNANHRSSQRRPGVQRLFRIHLLLLYCPRCAHQAARWGKCPSAGYWLRMAPRP